MSDEGHKQLVGQHDGHRHCGGATSSSSVHQTLDEMAFERGIWYSAMHGDVDRLKTLLDDGRSPVDANLRDSYGYTALHYASGHGHLTACEELLRRGADPNAVTRAGNATPLHRAAYRGRLDVARILVNKGGRLDSKDADGMTPLHKAAEGSQDDVCKLILAIDPATASVKDNRGRTAADLGKLKLTHLCEKHEENEGTKTRP